MDNLVADLVEKLRWKSRVFLISSLRSEGTKVLCSSILKHLEIIKEQEMSSDEARERFEHWRYRVQQEVSNRIAELEHVRRQNLEVVSLEDAERNKRTIYVT